MACRLTLCPVHRMQTSVQIDNLHPSTNTGPTRWIQLSDFAWKLQACAIAFPCRHFGSRRRIHHWFNPIEYKHSTSFYKQHSLNKSSTSNMQTENDFELDWTRTQVCQNPFEIWFESQLGVIAFRLHFILFIGCRTDVKQWRRWLRSPCCFDRSVIDSTRSKPSDTNWSNASWHQQPTSIGNALHFSCFYFCWHHWCRHVPVAARVNGKEASRRSSAPTSTSSRYRMVWTPRPKCLTCLVTRFKCFTEDFSTDLASSTCSAFTSHAAV